MRVGTESGDLAAPPTCPLCEEPLGRAHWSRSPHCEPAPFPQEGAFDLCPFCRILFFEEKRLESAPPADPRAEACPLCGGEGLRVECAEAALPLELEETTARLAAVPRGPALWCAGCRALHLPEGTMELHGIEVALQRSRTRGRIGLWLQRGLVLGALIGAVLVPVFWPWEGVLEILARIGAGALLGGVCGWVVGGIAAFAGAWIGREHRERLS